MKMDWFKKGLKAGIPIGLGYFAVSFAFGIMCVSNGLSPFQAVLISFTNLTSAGQFAGLGIIVANGGLLEMALTELIINLRYCLMSLSVSQKLDRSESWFHRYFVSFGVTDEIFAVSVAQKGKISAFFSYGAMSVSIFGWSAGTLAGAILGDLLPSQVVSALSVALYGMFIAIIIPPSKTNKAILYTVLGAMALSSCFAYLPLLNKVSSGFVIIIVTVVVSAIAAYFAPVKEEVNE